MHPSHSRSCLSYFAPFLPKFRCRHLPRPFPSLSAYLSSSKHLDVDLCGKSRLNWTRSVSISALPFTTHECHISSTLYVLDPVLCHISRSKRGRLSCPHNQNIHDVWHYLVDLQRETLRSGLPLFACLSFAPCDRRSTLPYLQRTEMHTVHIGAQPVLGRSVSYLARVINK